MKKVKIERIIKTTYEGVTYWVEYTINGENIGYIITEEFKEGEEKIFQELIDNGKYDVEEMIDKKHISICNKLLVGLIENCRQSENEMWFVENGEISEEQIKELEKEDIVLGLDGYITFREDGNLVTIYGGIITEFLF